MNVDEFISEITSLLDRLDTQADKLAPDQEISTPEDLEKARQIINDLYATEAETIQKLKNAVAELFPREEMLFFDLTPVERIAKMEELDALAEVTEETAPDVLKGEESDLKTATVAMFLCILDQETVISVLEEEAKKDLETVAGADSTESI